MHRPDSFIWKMAWRDSRSSRRRLLLFSISITLGIAALVGIGSFRQSLAQAIDDQARSLIGADLVVESTAPFQPRGGNASLAARSGARPGARESAFPPWLFFRGAVPPASCRSARWAAIFHFTARWRRCPRRPRVDFRAGGRALVEESLLLQFQARVGDPIKIGDAEFTIAGALRKMPGEASAAGSFAPRVYIPLQNLAATNLLKPGSIARYRDYVKFPDGTDVEKRIETLAPQIQRLGLEYDTVAKRKRDLGTALENLYRFLNLVGFVSLLLGAVGVASAIQAHLQQKTRTGAILRCLGMSSRGTVLVYLLQTAAMGLVGATTGAALGVAMQRIFPRILKSFLAARDPDGDRLGTNHPRRVDWLCHLRPVCAAGAAAVSAPVAVARLSGARSTPNRARQARSDSLARLCDRSRPASPGSPSRKRKH